MKISRIEAFQPATPGSPADWRTQLGQIVVRIETEDGLSGIGVGGGGLAGVHVVQTVLADLLRGRDARDVEGLHDAMVRHTVFYGRKGLVVMAISGVDLALWDLRGQRDQRPVALLLNPRAELERELPTYRTVPDAAQAEAAWREGERAIKLHVGGAGRTAEEVERLVREVRSRLGPEATLMLDAFATWDVETSLRVADALGPGEIAWLEEPLPPDDLEGYERLVRRCPVPIAGGEHEYLADGFRELIRRGLHAVLQPDINWCGGMTSLVEIYRLAGARGLRVCPHRGGEPFALQAIAALDRQPLAESPRPWFRCLQGAPEARNGCVPIPVGNGFGVQLT